MRSRVATSVALLCAAVLLGACQAEPPVQPAVPRAVASTTPSPSPPVPPVPLVAWHGPVEQLFFHTLVVRPGLAFTDDTLGHSFADYSVTATEFRRILTSLWHRGWTLVDVHRVAAGTVRVPAGRRPLVLSEDDVNYYDYARERGQPWRLVTDSAGRVRAELRDADGTHPRLSDDDLVPLVDAFVAAHPEFSADGAKGLLALTGYEGLFGERLEPPDPAAADRVRRLAQTLRDSGWTLASHTYGHIHLERDRLAIVARDTARWRALAEPLLGPTDVLVYPYGGRPVAGAAALLASAGFHLQLDIDIVPRTERRQGYTLMSRRHVDGLAFDVPARLAPFFDVQAVRDPAARSLEA
ncbi:MAG: glycoside hydrolase/deacetylase [Frankiales bacterium]|nr:glycoside hydrolase/deacetylase [Frankiales bacterium]